VRNQKFGSLKEISQQSSPHVEVVKTSVENISLYLKAVGLGGTDGERNDGLNLKSYETTKAL
jgi:hypothetical protein